LAPLVLLAIVAPAFAQDGKLTVRVPSKKAYVFIKGRAAPVGGDTLELSPDGHKIALYSHAYEHNTRRVRIDAGNTAPLDVSLKPVSDTVSGRPGRMPIKGGGCAPVLLNGQLPDELNNDIIWMLELLVLQESLRDQGYYTGQIDGALGPLTRAAIRQCQKSQKMPVTSRLDAQNASKSGVGREGK
jgi:hypothetical protein